MEQNPAPSSIRGRKLLPAPPNPNCLPPQSLAPSKDRKSISACEMCRKRKTKCDAKRPMCSSCVYHGLDCVYQTSKEDETHAQSLKRKYAELSERKSAHEEIYRILQTRSEEEATEILTRIRNGVDAESILRQIQDGDVLLQLTLVPETRYRYEFPFVKEMPAFLQRVDNAYLNSLVYEWTRKGFQAGKLSDAAASKPEPAYLKPYHAAELVDARINVIKPSNWTSVCADDKLMRKFIAAYFMYGSQFFICFHKDYFLNDMALNRHRYCSSLLVNAVLAVGYSCYRGAAKRYEHWNPQNLGYRFLAEAKRLWELEIGNSRLTTIHAGLVITLVHNMSCLDKVGWTYTLQAITIAHDLRLFDPTAKVKGLKERRAREFTAWALFNYQCLHCYVMFDEPVIKQPPTFVLPDPSVDPEWYGEIWIQYPLSTRPVSTYFGHLFKACADMRVIMNDICMQCFVKPTSLCQVTLEQVLDFHTRLKDWKTNLPGPLTPERIVFPSQFILHMNYQTVLINLHEPFRADQSFQHDHITRVLAAEANAHLETLIRLYFLRHGFESFDPFLIHPLNVLGFSTINKINTNPAPEDIDATRSTIILAAKGMYEQGQSHYIGYVTLQFLKSSMRLEDIQLLGQIAALGAVEDKTSEQQMNQIQARWAPSIIRVTDDPEAQRLSNLVKEYMDMHLDSESDQASST